MSFKRTIRKNKKIYTKEKKGKKIKTRKYKQHGGRNITFSIHARERMDYFRLTEDYVKSIINTVTNPVFIHEESGNHRYKYEDGCVVVITNDDIDNVVVITAYIKELQSISRVAQQSIEDNNISEQEIDDLYNYIMSYEPDEVTGVGNQSRLIFRYNNLEVITNSDRNFIIFIKRTYTPSVRPSRPEPSRPEPSRPEPSRPEPSRPEPSRPEPSRAQPSRAPEIILSGLVESKMSELGITLTKIKNIMKTDPEEIRGPRDDKRLKFEKGGYVVIASEDRSTVIDIYYTSPAQSSRAQSSRAQQSYEPEAPQSLRDNISQPYEYHPILGRDKSAIGRRANSSNLWAIDCARCAASYSGLGMITGGLPQLQNKAVADNGISAADFDKWLEEFASYRGVVPQLYAIHPNFIESFGKTIALTAKHIAEKLLGPNDIAMIEIIKDYSMGHYLNIVKLVDNDTNKETIWIVDPQSETDAGEYTLAKYISWFSSKDGDPVSNILFVLTPWQASQLVDNYGNQMVVLANYGNPIRGWWTHKSRGGGKIKHKTRKNIKTKKHKSIK